MGDLFSTERFLVEIPVLLPYLLENLKVLFYATVFGVLLGLLVTAIRMNKIPILYQFIVVYISFMRGTPMLVQLMLIYYGLPAFIDPLLGTNISREWPPILFAYTTFILNQGAFLSSIFYGAIKGVPTGQFEAGLSVGMTRLQTFRRIIAPMAIRIALPPFGTDFVGVVHNASLVYVIGVIDILGRAKSIGSATGHALEAYVVVALNFVICSILTRVFFGALGNKLDYANKKTPAYEKGK